MTSLCRRLLLRQAFSESGHFSWDIDPANTMACNNGGGGGGSGGCLAVAAEALQRRLGMVVAVGMVAAAGRQRERNDCGGNEGCGPCAPPHLLRD